LWPWAFLLLKESPRTSIQSGALKLLAHLSHFVQMYCLVVHPLQPGLILLGSNVGVLLIHHCPTVLPRAVALPAHLSLTYTPQAQGDEQNKIPSLRTPDVSVPDAAAGTQTVDNSGENSVLFLENKKLQLLAFRASLAGQTHQQDSFGQVLASDPQVEAIPQVIQAKFKVASTDYDGYAKLASSPSGKYTSLLWPDLSHYEVYRSADWSLAEAGSARFLAWDTCKDRFAIIAPDSIPQVSRSLLPSIDWLHLFPVIPPTSCPTA
jgi:hypothetical protein